LRTVGLIGPADRPELQRLAIRLEERGGAAIFVDPRRDSSIVMSRDRLSACGEEISGASALYVADLGMRSVTSSDSASSGSASAGDADSADAAPSVQRSMRHLAAWNALFDRFAHKGGLVVNPPVAQELHALKPREILAYAPKGIPAPRTVATSDPLVLARLGDDRRTAWVIKGMVGGYAHTERFEPPSSLDDAQRLLGAGPVQLQELIEGDNVRAFVLAGEMIGAARFIPLDGTEIDSRRGKARIQSHDLPEEAARHAVAAAGLWGMSFAAIDFMRDERTGRYVVLECNSAPFFVGFEASTGVEISGRLANHLLGIRRGR